MPDDAEKSKYIPMYYSYIEQLGLLSLEQVGALVMALLVYGRDGTQPDFPKDGNVYMAFSFIADNSMRAEIRRQEIVEKRREAGRIRAASAEKDESGRFVQQKASKKPALSSKSSTDQQIQLYKDKDNNKDNNNNNRRIRAHAHAYANDDGFDDGWSEREREIVAFCREVEGHKAQAGTKGPCCRRWYGAGNGPGRYIHRLRKRMQFSRLHREQH